ncbi:MAG: DegV family protein [Acutalibacteraceae bacterium]
MNDYVIVTDSCADLSPKLIKEMQIEVIPLCFSITDKTYHNYPDHREMDITEFYNSMRAGNMSTTAQLNPSDITDALTPILESGRDVLYIVFSSGLSGTYQSACLAAEELYESFPDRKVIVVDSLAASMGQGLLVWHAVQKKKDGMSIEEVAKWVEENRDNLCHWFTVDDLHHLKRGGRVSAAAAIIGSALGIKPVLHVDNEGHLIPVKKVRGRRQSLDALVEMMEQSAIFPKEQTVFISHGDSLDDAKYVEKQVKEKLKVKNVKINYIGPVIGSHSGPGTIALFFIGSEK